MADDGDSRRDGARRGRAPRRLNGFNAAGDDRIVVPWWLIGGCPDSNQMGAFLERRLPPPHHQLLLDHITRCTPCLELFKECTCALAELGAFDFSDEGTATSSEPVERPSPPRASAELPPTETQPRPPAPPARRRWPAVPLPAAVGAAVLTLALGWWLPRRDPRAQLASVVPAERPVKARFGAIPWAAAASPQRGAGDAGRNLSPGAVAYLAIAELHGRGADASDANELGVIGAAQVMGGRVDAGVDALARAVAADPGSPELLSDLGAAHLARAERATDESVEAGPMEGGADVIAALEAIDEALEKSPELPEALFNRALALEALHLNASARGAWQRYLAVDSRSLWAKEARERLAAVPVLDIPDAVRLRAEIAAAASHGDGEQLSELVQRERHLARRTAQEDLLPSWGEAALAGNASEARSRLAAARALAEEWEAQTTDPSLRSAVAEIERASGPAAEKLARGYRAFGEGSRALADFDVASAKAAADRALRALPSDSAAVAWSRALRLTCVYYESGDMEGEAARLIDDPHADFASRGRALWLAGLWSAKRGEATRAIGLYRRASAEYERVQEREPAIWLRHVIGEAYGYMGASGIAWEHRRSAMRSMDGLTDRKQAFSILLASALLALAERHPRVAADFVDEALAVPGFSEPFEIFQAYVWRCRVRYALGDIEGAQHDLARASTWYPRTKPIDARWLAGDLNLAVGLLAREPRDAVRALSTAADHFRLTGELYRLPSVLLARAQAHLRAGSVAAADDDLRQAALLNQQQQGTRFAELLWTAPLDQVDRLFDACVDLALKAGRQDDAFAVAEAGRARGLRVRSRNANGTHAALVPLRLADVRSRLEPGTTLLFFSVLQDRVVQWRIQRHQSSVVTLPLTPSEVTRMTSALEADLQAGAWTSATGELAMQLYTSLIRPGRLGEGPVVVVPDGELHRLPFAALINPVTRRFLIEERVVEIAASATSYVAAAGRSRAFGPVSPVNAFVVGDPRVSPALFPGLRPLENARAEAEAVASLYRRRQLLVGPAATRAALVRFLGSYQVVHFAGHAVNNRTNPGRSSLPLAAEEGDSGSSLLLGTEIASLDLTRTRVVVLSGCETAGGTLLDGEGSLSLARAFLAAGVPSVVASLWPIPDGPSSPLMTAFHRGLRNGQRPAAALRSAQMGMLRGSADDLRTPAVWASFQAFGG